MMRIEGELTPNQIMDAFSRARRLVSMSEGPADERDSIGEPYRTVTHYGQIAGGLTLPHPRAGNQSLEDFSRELVGLYFQRLFALAPAPSVSIEWRRWPEVMIDDMGGRIYSRLTIRPIKTI